MKKMIVFALCLSGAAYSYAQRSDFFVSDSQHYQVYSDHGQADADEAAAKLEAGFEMFNDLCHFDTSGLDVKLRVKIFAQKATFDTYLNTLISETRSDFVYIHYSDLRKSELVGFRKQSAEEFDASLLHQGFIQFFKAFVPNAPVWLREGIAAYLEKSAYDETSQSFTFKPNLVWVDTIKEIVNGDPITVYDLILFDTTQAISRIDTFYPEAWGLVQFLSEVDRKAYNRILWDSLSALKSDASLEDNSEAVARRAFLWADPAALEADFHRYVLSLKTFQDYVQEGMDLYGEAEDTKDEQTYALAEQAFQKALSLRPGNHVSHYYIGLIHYSRKEHKEADEHYRRALEAGLNTALIYYALGVNAFADDNYEAAEEYLKKALEVEPDDEKVQSLLNRIEVMR